ncbi:hypothetical protein AS026_26900 [Rhizobium altiplani]|uniref:Uncharacterized protein n=1 Tax=Rhizobium altiplani TaxID=1864509 RepID=A0A109K3H1_9HYPH|nr:hypothetical protein [Rhizobium altiplani]KWV59933.1 hypothetical protein AS026_26900 [Rhizobium altiplani]
MIFQYIPEITKSQKSQRERKASQSGANSLNVFEGIEDRFAQGGREAGGAIEQSGSKAGNALAAKLSAAGDQFAASIAGRILEAIDRCRRTTASETAAGRPVGRCRLRHSFPEALVQVDIDNQVL